MKKVILFVAVSLLGALCAFGQSDRGTITGTVSDTSGAVIPGAAVSAKNTQTGLVYTAGSSETGNYTLPQLPVGTYEVTVELPGFKKFVSPGIAISGAQVARIDAKLEVGDMVKEVSVESSAVQVELQQPVVGNLISGAQITARAVAAARKIPAMVSRRCA